MRYDNTMIYGDNVFLRAIELGCEPVPGKQLAEGVCHWLCACSDNRHAGEGETGSVITWSRLGTMERATA